MENLGSKIRARRKQQRLSQEDLGKQAKCSQAAISQVENGVFSAVSDETLKTLLRLLGLEAEIPATVIEDARHAEKRLLFCSQAQCPMNQPYDFGGQLRFKPHFMHASGAGHLYCPGCGTPLLDRCPNARCQAELTEGSAFCIHCGVALVSTPKELENIPDPRPFIANFNSDAANLDFRSRFHELKTRPATADGKTATPPKK